MYMTDEAVNLNSIEQRPNPKVKFCWAVIPKIIYFALIVQSSAISINNLFSSNGYRTAYYGNVFVEDVEIFDLYLISNNLCYILFTLLLLVVLLLKIRNAFIPVLMGVRLIVTNIIKVLYEYYLSPGLIAENIFWRCFNITRELCLFSLLFVLVSKRPSAKRVIGKHKTLWKTVIPIIYTGLYFVPYIASWAKGNFSAESIMLTVSLELLVICFRWLLLRWLTEPYKKAKPPKATVKSRVQNFWRELLAQITEPTQTSLQPAEPSVFVPPVTPMQNSLETVEQAETKTTKSAVEELVKCKELLDSGVITFSEFERLKADIINKQ